MNRLLLFFLILTSFSCNSKEKLHFKIQFKPERVYHISMQNAVHSQMVYPGMENRPQQRQSGNDDMLSHKVDLLTEAVITTGSLTDDTHFLLALEITSNKRIKGNKDVFDGTTFYYTASTKSAELRLDSISPDPYNERLRWQTSETLRKLFTFQTLPVKMLRVGDSFTIEEDQSTSVKGGPEKKMGKTVYTLTGIKNGIATFRITTTAELETIEKEGSDKISARGKGELQYDIEAGYPVNYILNTNAEMSMNGGGIPIKSKLTASDKQQIRIGK